jgi:hypothetical protein
MLHSVTISIDFFPAVRYSHPYYMSANKPCHPCSYHTMSQGRSPRKQDATSSVSAVILVECLSVLTNDVRSRFRLWRVKMGSGLIKKAIVTASSMTG